MTTQDLGKTLLFLLLSGIAGFTFVGVSLLHGTPTQTHAHPVLCFSSTVAMFWLALVLWVCVGLKKTCGSCHEKTFPQSCCGMIFGFLLFWAFIGFNLQMTGYFSGHHSPGPLLPIFFFLSAFLLVTLWLATNTASSSSAENH